EVPEPTGPGLLVRVLGCGLCGSDVEKIGRSAAGTVLGHEVAGVLENGDRVTVLHHVPCGTCERCRAGHQSTCGEFRETRIQPGGFAELLRATHCVPLPEVLGELDGVWVEPLACILRAAERVPRGRVLVVGAGAIGQLWVQVLARRGDHVVVAEPRDDRRARALELGARNGEDPVAAAVVTAPRGINDALHRLEPGGTLVVFAEGEPAEVDAIYRKELTVVGSRSGTPAFFRQAIDVLPTLVLPKVTTLPLARFLEGVELYRAGDVLKVVYTP
ncbi:MAG TPA: alcohol dehydrogenase catalytic domain-containing protein, partial [Gaiellaceae bacterium]